MSDIVVEIQGLDELRARLDRIASDAVLRGAMQRSCNLVQRKLAVYPPASGKPHGPWKSERQRRYVMALVAAGGVPYRRTGTLGRRWTSRVDGSGLDTVGVVGNNTVYGPYVMGKGAQAAYHAGTWPVAEQVAQDSVGEIATLFADAIQAALARD